MRELHGTQEDYLRALETRFAGLDLAGISLLLDCAHGATYRVGPEIFRRLGASVTVIGDEPDGRNINDGVGSTHIEALAAAVVAGGHDLGFAFDGDGDRVLAADRSGATVDGDELIALAAIHLRASGRLSGNGVVVTVMTNYGFHTAMAEADIGVATADVGDRYVLAELRDRGWTLGGEQSGADLAERSAMQKLPQQLVNVKVADKATALEAVAAPAADEGEKLSGRGRVLVRASGTEQLVRVMVEAPDAEECEAICARLVAVVEAAG